MTEINVTVGPATLLQQSRQQVEANRWSRAEQDAQKRTEAAARAARQQQDQQGAQRYGDPSRPRLQRQKPAAFRFDEAGLSHFWINNRRGVESNITGAGENDGVITSGDIEGSSTGWYALTQSVTTYYLEENVVADIVSSDGSKTTQLQAPSNVPRGGNISSGYIALPVGPGIFILIAGGYRITEQTSYAKVYYAQVSFAPGTTDTQIRSYFLARPSTGRVVSFSASSSRQRFLNAFICSQSSVRAIGIPNKMQSVLDFILPEPDAIQKTTLVYPNWPSSSGGSYQYSYTSYIPAGGILDHNGDPRVFTSINEAAVDNGLPPLINTGSPVYQRFFYPDSLRTIEDPAVANWLAAYKTWQTDDPSQAISSPRHDYRYPRSITEPPDFGTWQQRRALLDITTLGASSSYCRQMCLALGFSAADLTP